MISPGSPAAAIQNTGLVAGIQCSELVFTAYKTTWAPRARRTVNTRLNGPH